MQKAFSHTLLKNIKNTSFSKASLITNYNITTKINNFKAISINIFIHKYFEVNYSCQINYFIKCIISLQGTCNSISKLLICFFIVSVHCFLLRAKQFDGL